MHERLRVLPYGKDQCVMRHRTDASAPNAYGISSTGQILTSTHDHSYGHLYTLLFPC